MAWSFLMVTFGCKVNQYETQSLREAWLAMGGVETDDAATADVIFVNTCAVTANAVTDARQAVRRLHREAPDAQILLSGCAAEVAKKELAVLPGVAAVFGQADKPKLLTLEPLRSAPFASADAISEVQTFPPFQIAAFRRARPVLKVQDGCSHRCAYCIVPQTRGRPRSRAPEECLAELQRLFTAGYREVMLSGINLRQYAGQTEKIHDFWDLVAWLDRELAPEWGPEQREDPVRLRISSVDPAQLSEKGLACLASTRLVCPHLHLSLQSGSPAILRAMRREHYTPEMLLQRVDAVTAFWPRLGLGADILMGFPGETEQHVLETLEVVRQLPLTYAHVFPFSPRPGTPAASLPGQLEKREKQHRAARVRDLVEQKKQLFWKQTLRESRLLVALDSNEGGEGQHGIDECYVPCQLAAPVQGAGHALIPVRPVRMEKQGLLVEPIV